MLEAGTDFKLSDSTCDVQYSSCSLFINVLSCYRDSKNKLSEMKLIKVTAGCCMVPLRVSTRVLFMLS